MLASRRTWWIAGVLSLGALVGSVFAMAHRIERYYRESDHRLYVWNKVGERQFSYAGRPVVIADEKTPEGSDRVSVRYGDEALSLTPTIEPGPAQLPGLNRHEDWMQVWRFAEHGRASLGDVERAVTMGRIADRLVLVVRTPPPGEAPAPNEAYRKYWLFDFYEFRPAGGFEHQRLSFPLDDARKRWLAEHGQKPPPEMTEGSWQYFAALNVMPPLWKPPQKFRADAMSAAGWTLPASAIAALALTVSGVALVAPRRNRGGDAPAH
jgi:hypothetical protein